MTIVTEAGSADIALPSSAGVIRHPLREALTRPVVLLFHPGVGMGLLFSALRGCSGQMCEINGHRHDIEAAGATVYGVSTMPAARNSRFAAEHHLSIELLSDAAGMLGDVFSIGRASFGGADVFDRTAVVVSAAPGGIAFSVLPEPNPSLESIIEAVKQMGAGSASSANGARDAALPDPPGEHVASSDTSPGQRERSR